MKLNAVVDRGEKYSRPPVRNKTLRHQNPMSSADGIHQIKVGGRWFSKLQIDRKNAGVHGTQPEG